MATGAICSIEGCDKAARTRKLCHSHYHRLLRYGDPLQKRTAGTGEPLRWLTALVSHMGDDCVFWPFGRNPHTAEITVGGVRRKAARFMCELAHGKPPRPDFEAAHSCGNGHLGCVNPHHLRWDTRAGNQADRVIHDTHKRGERQWCSKLTEADVRAIRNALAAGATQASLSRRYGVDQSHISNIKRRKAWAWLE